VLREARTQVFTEATIEDHADANQVIGFATADWAVLAPTPEGFVYTDPGHGVPDTPDLPPLTEAYDARPNAGDDEPAAGRSRSSCTRRTARPRRRNAVDPGSPNLPTPWMPCREYT
jgi:hypothetical protein